MQEGSFGRRRSSAVLRIQDEPGSARRTGRTGAPVAPSVALLAPTGRLMDGDCHAMIVSARARFFSLESSPKMMPSGLPAAAKQGADASGAVAAPAEEISEEGLRRIYAQRLLTAKEESGVREAPLRKGLDLYRLKGFRRGGAVKLGRSKATVMNHWGRCAS